ncbi:MAG TPA: c-type cytochrome [Acidobacteriaceae bacterium]|jgi:mono/diheme cytochrome c family protein|nr:c-type cytochrome [Acidobacteriaceae bacterium]
MWPGAMILALPLFLAVPLILAGCEGHEAKVEPIPARPEEVVDFPTLYGTNCAACHGATGHGGPAMELGNPEYQALVDDATLRKWISGGMPGTEMPAFAQSAGGMLTDAQVNALIAGMRKEWARPDVFAGATPPAYAQPAGGDGKRGQATYQARCSGCHQEPSREQVTSAAYLSLVSDQALRTVIIAGRTDIGQPDWRLAGAKTASAPLSGQDVTDIVTYLGSLRNPSSVSAAPQGRSQ